ncbi:MAG: homoserine dehydrogenase [Clostridia bacterium]|nr:homoserine dehydrogenase [Clostridia bacterium]
MSKVAILGFGVVGSGVYEILKNTASQVTKNAGKPVQVKYILDIREFDNHPEKHLFVKDFATILADEEVDVVAEVIGGATVAYEFTKAALLAGKNVVTSNKELVATHGTELLKIAQDKGVSYLFEASVGGGIPLIHPLHRCLTGNNITKIMGILNGTTNYILTSMLKDNKSFEDALKDAQAKGYAEANPAADVEGIDACRKIAILSSLAYGRSIKCDDIHTEGITKISLSDAKYAEKAGYAVKLIGYSKKEGDKAEVWVGPMLIPGHMPLSKVDDVFNAGMVTGDNVGDVMFYGRGAGMLPTASAVVGDIIDIVTGSTACAPISWTEPDIEVVDFGETVSKYYVRAAAEDLNAVKTLFADAKIIETDSDEIAFITEKEIHRGLVEKLEKLQSVKSLIKVYEE